MPDIRLRAAQPHDASLDYRDMLQAGSVNRGCSTVLNRDLDTSSGKSQDYRKDLSHRALTRPSQRVRLDLRAGQVRTPRLVTTRIAGAVLWIVASRQIEV